MKSRKLRVLLVLSLLTLSIALVGMTIKTEAKVTASPGDVLINEFSVAGSSYENMELKNTLGTPVDIQNWQIWRESGGSIVLMGTVTSAVTIPANGYVQINDTATVGNMDNFYLSDGGDIVQLRDDLGNVIDMMAYGEEGGAPTHPYGVGSVSRVGTGGTNASDWNIDLTATYGAANDAPGTNLGGADVVINEAFTGGSRDFVELYNVGSSSVNLAGWVLSSYTRQQFTLSGYISAGGYMVIYEDDPAMEALSFPPLPLAPETVVHLYDDTGVRVDQVGWNTAPTPLSWNRFPDGNTNPPFTSIGYSNLTSGFVDLPPTPGEANSDEPFIMITDFVQNDTAIALNGAVEVAAYAEYNNGTLVDGTMGSVSVDVGGTATVLTYDPTSEYFNGTIDFTGYTPSMGTYGFYHTTELEITATAGTDEGISTAGVLVNPGYGTADTVMMIDEAHDQMYAFTIGLYPNAPWATMLVTAEIVDYVMVLDLYDHHFRISNDVLTDVDLLVITAPDANPDTPHDVEDTLQASEITTIFDYVEAGGSLWLSEVGAAYSIPDENGIGALTAMWGLEWFRGYYIDDSFNLGQNNYCIIPIEREDGTAFDDFDAFGAEEYYHNGMILNKSEDIAGVTVTEVIEPSSASGWDDIEDSDYEANMNPVTHEYSVAYVVENGTGKAFVTGSSSLWGHYYDYEQGFESGQFAFNVFCYLLGVNPVQFPKLSLTDEIGSQTVTTDNSSVTFTVDLTSSLTGATLYNVEVSGLISGDPVDFTAVGDGTYTATWDATYTAAGTYSLKVTATAENMYGGSYIDAELDITLVVQEPETTTTTKGAPGFELVSVLAMFSILGLAYAHFRKRR